MSREEWKTDEYNKSISYILPMLGYKIHQFVSKYVMPQCQFRKCVIGDNSREISNKILLVYEFTPQYAYETFVGTLKKHENFEKLYELDNEHTVFMFSIPNEYLSEYNKILKGKYSSLSNSYKDHIIKFHEVGEESDLFGILHRTGRRIEKLEQMINDGLPRQHWTKIPPFAELEETFKESEEVLNYQNNNILSK